MHTKGTSGKGQHARKGGKRVDRADIRNARRNARKALDERTMQQRLAIERWEAYVENHQSLFTTKVAPPLRTASSQVASAQGTVRARSAVTRCYSPQAERALTALFDDTELDLVMKDNPSGKGFVERMHQWFTDHYEIDPFSLCLVRKGKY
jgi:hypothetical protein